MRRAVRAAVAGLVAAVLVALMLAASLLAAFSTSDFLSNTPDQPNPLALLVLFLVTPAGLFAAGVLLAVAVGGGWLRSPLISGVVLGASFLVVYKGPSILTILGLPSDRNDVMVALVLVFAPALVVSVASARRGASAVWAVALLSSTALLAVLSSLLTSSNAVLVGWSLGLCAWVLLPAVATGLQAQNNH